MRRTAKLEDALSSSVEADAPKRRWHGGVAEHAEPGGRGGGEARCAAAPWHLKASEVLNEMPNR